MKSRKQGTGKTVKTIISLFVTFILFISLTASIMADPYGDKIKSGDILCFGNPDDISGFDGRWIVLDADSTNTGDDGMFLLSLSLIGSGKGDVLLYRDIGDVSVSFSDRGEEYAASHPGVLEYQGSDIQKWCQDFFENSFTEAEKSAFIPTYKSDDAIVIKGFGIPLPGAAAGTVDFSPAENALCGDLVFIPSVEEVTSEKYGFTDNRSRVALFNGAEGGYWLRSPHIPTFPLDVGFVFSFGAVMDYPVNAKSMFDMKTYARPACNIESEKITGLTKLSETDGRTVWKASFEGEENGREYSTVLPVIGEVIDLNRTAGIIFWGSIVLILLIIALVVFLIVRAVRKKKKKKTAENK